MASTRKPVTGSPVATVPALPDLPHAPGADGGQLVLAEVRSLPAVPAQLPVLAGFLVTIRDMRGVIKSHYTRLLGPFEDAVQNGKAMRTTDDQPWAEAERLAAERVVEIRDAQRRESERIARDRQVELQRQAREKAEADRREQERLLAEMKADAATKKAAKEIDGMIKDLVQAPIVVAPVPLVAPAPLEKMDLLSERVDRSALVVDLAALVQEVAAGRAPLEAVLPNQVWLNVQAGKRKEDGELFPGVSVVSKVVMVRKPSRG